MYQKNFVMKNIDTTLNTNGAEQASAGLLELLLKKPQISSTAGSCAWLLAQGIRGVFWELPVPHTTDWCTRVAAIVVGTRYLHVAVDGSRYDPEINSWVLAEGIQSIPLAFVELESLGVASLTPAARLLLELAASTIREEFAAWIKSDSCPVDDVAVTIAKE